MLMFVKYFLVAIFQIKLHYLEWNFNGFTV